MRRVDLRSRRGLSGVLSTVLLMPLLILIVGMMLYFGRALYVKAALEDAASAGARFAAASLSGARGCAQARQAAFDVLAGHYLDPAGASIAVRPVTVWGRGTQAEIELGYTVGQRYAPVIGALLGDTRVGARYRVVIDGFNNRWADGYQRCG
jgi:Flp pilus assembly protein TadG